MKEEVYKSRCYKMNTLPLWISYIASTLRLRKEMGNREWSRKLVRGSLAMGAWGGECCTEQMGGIDFYEK